MSADRIFYPRYIHDAVLYANDLCQCGSNWIRVRESEDGVHNSENDKLKCTDTWHLSALFWGAASEVFARHRKKVQHMNPGLDLDAFWSSLSDMARKSEIYRLTILWAFRLCVLLGSCLALSIDGRVLFSFRLRIRRLCQMDLRPFCGTLETFVRRNLTRHRVMPNWIEDFQFVKAILIKQSARVDNKDVADWQHVVFIIEKILRDLHTHFHTRTCWICQCAFQNSTQGYWRLQICTPDGRFWPMLIVSLTGCFMVGHWSVFGYTQTMTTRWSRTLQRQVGTLFTRTPTRQH